VSEKEIVKIEAERIGLPATASAVEIRDAVYADHAQLVKVTAERDLWRERAEENQALAMEYKQGNEDKKVLEGKLLIEAARNADKIEKSEEDFYLALWLKDPKLCTKRLESLEEKKYLRRQDSLKGPIGDLPADPLGELAAKTAELIANNSKLTQAEAVQLAYKQDPKLFERVTEARRATVAAKGGER
jgi:single-stranded DNA-specific DHH superfamily exonuclease